MQSTGLSWGMFFSASPALPREVPPEVTPGGPEPVAPPPKRSRKKGLILGILGLAIVAAIGWFLGPLREVVRAPSSTATVLGPPTVTAALGTLERRLRVSGTIAAEDFAAIRAPTMRAGREAGRSQLTLINLAAAGSIVKQNDVVAEFEFKWLEDHIDDVQSSLVQSESDVSKRRAEIMILRQTEAQALRTARGERDKAELDLRTAEVRSEIEAEILRLNLQETEAALKQLEEEYKLQEIAHNAELRSLELKVAKNRMHMDRHMRDLERMKSATPVPGLVVMESMFRGGGQFDQVASGDEVYPGTFFMRVVDLSGMNLLASVNQVDSQLVRIGQEAEVRLDAYPSMVLAGKVTEIGAMATSGGQGGSRWGRGFREDFVKQVPITIKINAQDERIIPDLSGSADILLTKKENALVIPRAAVRTRDGQPLVLVRRGQTRVEREIKLGDQTATQVIVLEGLEPGEEVVVGRLPSIS
jgi:multidrug efflux pump subunit AcrA (membrane-fusion protein)